MRETLCLPKGVSGERGFLDQRAPGGGGVIVGLSTAAVPSPGLRCPSSLSPVYGKPVLPSGSTSPSPLPFLHGSLAGSTPQAQPPPESAEKEPEQDSPAPPGDGGTGSGTVESLPRPLSPTKLTPIVHSPLRYQSDADLEALRRKLANAPRPLKKRSSITEPEGPGGPNIQKLLYQRFNTLAGGMEGTPFYQPGPSQDFMGTLADVDNGNTTNGNLGEASPARPTAPLPTEPAPSSDANDNELPSPEPEGLICPQSTHQTAEPAEDDNNNVATAPPTEQVPSPGAEAPSPGEDQAPPPLPPAVPPPGASTVGVVLDRGPGFLVSQPVFVEDLSVLAIVLGAGELARPLSLPSLRPRGRTVQQYADGAPRKYTGMQSAP